MAQNAGKQTKFYGTQRLAVGGFFAALIAAGAFIRITIPVQPVPMHITLQWFFVLLAGLLFDARLACGSVCAYLLIGLSGVPVFASGGGPAYVLRPTFGFLLGFALAAWVMGTACERLRPENFFHMLIPAAAGLLAYYACGMAWFYVVSNFVLSVPVGWRLVLVNCCFLTVGADAALCLPAASAALRLHPVLAKLGWQGNRR